MGTKSGWAFVFESGLWAESFPGLSHRACRPVSPKLFFGREFASRCKRRPFVAWRYSLRTCRSRSQGGQLRIHCFATADILQSRLELAVRGFAQIIEFFGFQFAHFAGLDVQHQRTITNATNLFHVVADLFEHLAQLAVAALNDHDLVPGVVALADLANLCGRSLHPA